MDWEAIAPMVVAVVLFVTTGAVLILRPIAKRLGDLLEVMAEEKRVRAPDDGYRLREEIERLRSRMELLEDRQEFTEGLLGAGSAKGAGQLKE